MALMQGLAELRAHVAKLDDKAVQVATGLKTSEIDELAARYLKADKVTISWAMGLTQHKRAVPTIKAIINLLLFRGMRDGEIKVWFAVGGNLVAAISNTDVSEDAVRNTELSVQVSTKLNRSHAVVGEEALILPTMGRSEIDIQAGGEQFVTVEDTVCAVHASYPKLKPVAPDLLSEISIVSRLARAVLGDKYGIDWAAFERDYDTIREHIANVVPDCEDYNSKVRQKDGFVLPNGPGDSRTFPTAPGKAMITANDLEARTSTVSSAMVWIGLPGGSG